MERGAAWTKVPIRAGVDGGGQEPAASFLKTQEEGEELVNEQIDP